MRASLKESGKKSPQKQSERVSQMCRIKDQVMFTYLTHADSMQWLAQNFIIECVFIFHNLTQLWAAIIWD